MEGLADTTPIELADTSPHYYQYYTFDAARKGTTAAVGEEGLPKTSVSSNGASGEIGVVSLTVASEAG